MNAEPERHVPVVTPADVEAVGIDKTRGITVGGADRRHDHRLLSLLFNHRGCSWGTMSGWRSSAPLLTQGGH
jgi:hypothetical protein